MLGEILIFTVGIVVGYRYGFLLEFFVYRIYFAFQSQISNRIVDENVETKLVICVRSDLKMGKGKIASQCGHASIGAYLDSLANECKYLNKWLVEGQRKIVVKIPDYETMINVYKMAKVNSLNAHIVSDAGKTQVPNGSKTVISVGPGPAHLIDKITGQFALL